MFETQWLDSLDVEVPELDSEHRALVTGIFGLRSPDVASAEPRALLRHAEGLTREVVAHHRTEEAILTSHDYPWLAGHLADHRRLENGLAALMDSLGRNRAPDPSQMDWLIKDHLSHLIQFDQEYRWFFADRAIRFRGAGRGGSGVGLS